MTPDVGLGSMFWRFLRDLIKLQVNSHFVSFVVVAVAMWILPDTPGVLRFLLVIILSVRGYWNCMWMGHMIRYFWMHPEKDTFEDLPRTVGATTVRGIETLVLFDAIYG